MSIWQADRTLEDVERRIDIEKALGTLNQRQQAVLAARFNLDGDGDGATFEALGQVFNVQRERVRQIEAKGIRLLKHPMRRPADWKDDFIFRTPEEKRKRVKEEIEQKHRMQEAQRLAARKHWVETFWRTSLEADWHCPLRLAVRQSEWQRRQENLLFNMAAARAARDLAWRKLQAELSVK